MKYKQLHFFKLLVVAVLAFVYQPVKAQLTYCSTTNAGGSGSMINNVVFGSISNNTSLTNPTSSPYYSSFPTQTTTVIAGTVENLSVTIDPAGTYSGAIVSVWIDYNQNGTFEASEWQQVGTNIVGNTTATIGVNIPLTATLGTTGMRIRSRGAFNPNGANDACSVMGSGETEDYTITIAAATACAGVPNAGTAVANPASVCPSINTSLSVTGGTVASGLTYQWESSPAGANTWSGIAGATNANYSTTITANTDFRLIMTCTNGGGMDTSAPVTATLNSFINCYCTSGASNAFDGEIFNVTVGTMNNSSVCSSSNQLYTDYTGTVTAAPLGQGTSIPFSVTAASCGGSYPGGMKIYIDFNQNGLFTDLGEEVVYQGGFTYTPTGTVLSGTFLVPATATLGNTRMRVIMMEGGTATTILPCGTYGYGETEDYLVNIYVPPACSGQPTAGTAASSAANVCPASNFSLSLTGYSSTVANITIQWEQSPTGASSWTPLAGATNSTFTVTGGITTATDYRAVVTCTNGGGFDVSNTVTVGINPFYVCYCGPATGINLNSGFASNYITNVTIATTTLNNTTTSAGPGGYTLFYPTTSSTTTTLTQNVQYSISVTNPYTGYYTGLWIDYDANGIFDAAEFIQMTTTGSTATATFIVPLTAVPGFTGMRLRTYWQNYTATSACATSFDYETEDYVLTIAQALPCAGQPSPGTITAPTDVCPGTNFTLGLANYTTGLGISIAWESSPAGASSWAPIAGATNPTYLVTGGISAATDYRAVVTCANGGQFDITSVATVNVSPFYLCYCGPATGITLNSFALNYITNVAIPTTSLNNPTTTTAPGGYTLFYPTTTTTTAQLTQGTQYTLNTTHPYSGYFAAAWIDYDQNGTFDASEFMNIPMTGANGSVNFTVPLTATPGFTGMRIRLYWQSYSATQACATFYDYETEDYIIEIMQAPLCTGTPSAGAAVVPAGVCPSVPFNLTNSTYTVGMGITVQWQESPAGMNTWTDIPGATTPNYNVSTGIIAATDYRMWINCAGGGSDTTTSVSVVINPFFSCYCASGATSIFDGELFNVTVGTLNNTTGCPATSPSYSNFTSMTPPSLGQGTTVPVSFSAGSCGGSYGGYLKVYIDYNQNGSFSDPGEEAFVSGSFTYSPGGTAVSGNITIPLTATLGTTGMRVIMMETGSASSIQPCASYSYGETEDYSVTITTPPACLPVNTLTATNVLSTSVSLGWTSPGTATQWVIEYGPQGFTLGTGTTVTTSNNPHTLTGLNANTAYSFYVTADCGVAGLSAPSGPVNFMTAQIPQSVFPYAQNWESGGTDWTYSNGTQPNKWFVGPSVFFTGANSVYVSNNNGASNNYDINSSSVVAAYRDLDLTSFTGAVPMTFAWRAYGESGWDWLRVFVVPMTYFPIPGVSLYNNLPAGGVELSPSANGYNQSLTWQGVATNIPATFAGGLARLIFEWRNDGSVGTQPPAAIDALTIGGFPLAIDLKEISATNVGARNRVDWTTAAEVRGDKFELERSADGVHFTYLATINAKGEASNYSYWDEKPVSGLNHYQLKIVDATGNISYSKVVTALVKEGSFTIEAYPNPVTDRLTVNVFGSADKNATVSVSDAAGKVVKVVVVENGTAVIDMKGVAQGMYLVKYTDNSRSQTIKVNKR